MKLMLKIAAGVFLGVIASIVVLGGLYLHFVTLPQARITAKQAEARRTMTSLSPEQVITRCGKPSKDDDTVGQALKDSEDIANIDRESGLTSRRLPVAFFRSLTYDDLPDIIADGKVVWPHPMVLLNFQANSEARQWVFMNMGLGYTGTDVTTKIDDPMDELAYLPCLAAK